MEVKQNQSTESRPEGDRLTDAPLVNMDLPEFIKKIKNEPAWGKNDRNAITLYKTDEMRIVLIALHKDAIIAKHIANGVISVQVLEGEISFITEQQSVILKAGQMITLHKGEPHSVASIKESVFLLTLVPTLSK
ncbi:MAG: cupin domain-containing protein [Ginsengibacter sp.]